jgi:hypothetical protein
MAEVVGVNAGGVDHAPHRRAELVGCRPAQRDALRVPLAIFSGGEHQAGRDGAAASILQALASCFSGWTDSTSRLRTNQLHRS